MKRIREAYNLVDSEAEIQVLYAGEQWCAPGHAHAGQRSHALWHVVLDGRGRVKTAGKEWELGPGDSFLFLPNHSFSYQADASDPWHYSWLGLGGRRVETLVRRCGFGPESVVCRGGNDRFSVQEKALGILNLLDKRRDERAASSLRLQSDLYRLLDLLYRTQTTPPSTVPARVSYVSALKALMEQAYGRPLTIAGLAEYAGLERTYCARLFHQETGVGMRDYLTRLRMNKAAVLLRDTALSVTAVAESVGYPNEAPFSKRFKLVFGISPSGYRGRSTDTVQ